MRAITPGNADASRIVQRVEGAGGEPQMPFGLTPLPAQQIAALKTWINHGAPWPDSLAGEEHWSYLKPVKPAVPAIKDQTWPRNPIDHFVQARLEKEGLHPSLEADKATLIRRLSLDLIGLPPTPAEVAAFLNDTHPDAYDRLVDRLLASPHHRERGARKWLDLPRNADSNGYETDDRRSMLCPTAISSGHSRAQQQHALRSGSAIEQVAGDMLPSPTPAQANDQKIGHRLPAQLYLQ